MRPNRERVHSLCADRGFALSCRRIFRGRNACVDTLVPLCALKEISSERQEGMQPALWKPAVELSEQEEQIVKRIRRAKLFVFLRHHRHELLDEAFQQELAGLYRASKRGQPPIAPAQLALAIIVQAYTGVSDDEVIEVTLMDRRWQLVLDCLGTEQAPFSKGTLVAFRQRLIDAQMDRRLIERTIELASQSQEVGSRALRAALDSSPLWGAGRVEDTT